MLPSSSNRTDGPLLDYCLEDPSSIIAVMIYAVLNILLFPLYVLVLFVGFKQWRQKQQQGALSGAGSSCDKLTYNLALIEIIGCVGAPIFAASSWAQYRPALAISYCFFVMNFFGQAMFNCEICLDTYIAVVHPIVYRNLKEAKGVLIQNVIIAVSWVIIALWILVVLVLFPEFPSKALVAPIVIFTVTVLYCCLSALYVLTRPGPSGKKKQVDQTKLRAFHIILTITCLLFFKMIGLMVYLCVFILRPLTERQICLTIVIAVIIITPVNTVIPLLFLRRMKQMFC